VIRYAIGHPYAAPGVHGRSDEASVTRFYFHVLDDLDVPDEEGADLPDLAAARVHAGCAARSLMCDTMCEDRRISLHHRIDIEDAGGTVLATVRFADAVRVEGEPGLTHSGPPALA
jgi:hypothetical protein